MPDPVESAQAEFVSRGVAENDAARVNGNDAIEIMNMSTLAELIAFCGRLWLRERVSQFV